MIAILGNAFLNGADVVIQNTTRVYLIADSDYNAGTSAHT